MLYSFLRHRDGEVIDVGETYRRCRGLKERELYGVQTFDESQLARYVGKFRPYRHILPVCVACARGFESAAYLNGTAVYAHRPSRGYIRILPARAASRLPAQTENEFTRNVGNEPDRHFVPFDGDVAGAVPLRAVGICFVGLDLVWKRLVIY